ncbi:2OG-Fe dioxygenase family protein [Streptomyces sp. NPDC090025]|uniref:2OG-Fe dioxygenase family protein n=1 Tax=Streptomyces sp. NPDC090025 TaxID=3365922 RepID=UPI003832A7B9
MRIELAEGVDPVGAIGGCGYRLVEGGEFVLDGAAARAFAEFRGAWDDLALDAYLPGGASYRWRRHAKFLVTAAAGPSRLHGTGYRQTAEANPLLGGRVRELAPFRDAQATNPFFVALVRHDAALFDACAGPSAPSAWEVDAHLVRVTARPGTPGRPSPEGRHRDGFDYIALHHVARHNVTGGHTSLHTPSGELLAERTFTAPLDTLYAEDARILHDVTPLAPGPEPGPGHRDMLLMSFTRTTELTAPAPG